MMLTELYYYYANHPPAKAASQATFNYPPTGAKDACAAATITTFNIRHNCETAHNIEWLFDRLSADRLAGKPKTKAGRPASANAKPPLTRPRGTSSWTG